MNTRLQHAHGHWFVIAGAVLWGTTGTAQAFAPQGAQPATVGALRLAIGGAALLALASMNGSFGSGLRWPPAATAFAAGSMAAYQPLFFAGVAKTGVTVGTIVTIGSAPVLAGVLAFLVRRERPGRRWAGATTLAVLGCSLLIATGDSVSVDPAGITLALGAGAAYATYNVAGKRLLDELPADAAMAAVFCLAALLLAPLLIGGDLRWVAQPRGLAVALHLGLVATALAYVLFARGLHAVPVATAVTLSLAEPLTAGVLGIAVLGEQLTQVAFAGILLLLSGLTVISLGRSADTSPSS